MEPEKPMELEEIIEIMRMNDVPLKAALTVHEGYFHLIENGCLSDKAIPLLKVYILNIKESYDSIEMDVQTRETGKHILEEMKGLLDEYIPQLFDFLEKVEKDGGAHQIPKRIYELLHSMDNCADKFKSLPAHKIYSGARHIPKEDCESRYEWFRQGKPRVEKYDFSQNSLFKV